MKTLLFILPAILLHAALPGGEMRRDHRPYHDSSTGIVFPSLIAGVPKWGECVNGGVIIRYFAPEKNMTVEIAIYRYDSQLVSSDSGSLLSDHFIRLVAYEMQNPGVRKNMIITDVGGGILRSGKRRLEFLRVEFNFDEPYDGIFIRKISHLLVMGHRDNFVRLSCSYPAEMQQADFQALQNFLDELEHVML